MPIQVLMPALSPTMTEGTLSKWIKKEGDSVKPGEVIAEIETDKATMEVESVDEGILGKILVAAGTENVPVNKLIALILEEGESSDSINNYAEAAPKPSNIVQEAQQSISASAAPVAPANIMSNNDSRIMASPLAKRIASNEGIDISNVKGSGPRGRIIKQDVLESLSNKTSMPAAPKAVATSTVHPTDSYTKIPNNNMRKVIAKRLLESKQTVPHFYLNIECRLDKLMEARKQLNDAAGDKGTYKISVNDLVIKASALALRDIPEANSSWTDEAILQYNNVDISVAVAIDGGLITPIIRNADQKSLSAISNEMKELAKKAREGKLQPHEYQGGGFSISNLGMYGIKQFNAIINPPQSCILAVGAGIEKPIIENGQVKIGTTMEITLSCDHRVVDGAVGARFLEKFKNYIENPVLMLV